MFNLHIVLYVCKQPLYNLHSATFLDEKLVLNKSKKRVYKNLIYLTVNILFLYKKTNSLVLI